jgi:hypothetical protein
VPVSFAGGLFQGHRVPAIAKEVGDRAEEGKAYGKLGIAYHSLGDYAKAIEYHGQNLVIG